MSFDNLMGMWISMCMQNFITIFHSVQEIAPLSLFSEFGARQSLDQWKCHFAISWARSCLYQWSYPHSSRDRANFHFFRIWSSAKPRPMINVIFQFLELDLVNINVSAKFYQTIPNCLRVKIHFFRIWTAAKPRPIPNVIWLYPGLRHVNINVYAKFHYNIPLSSRDRTIFTIWSSAKPRPMKNFISNLLG